MGRRCRTGQPNRIGAGEGRSEEHSRNRSRASGSSSKSEALAPLRRRSQNCGVIASGRTSLVWKDIKVKYKQTALGVAWVVLQPVMGMLLFTLLFGKVAKLPNDGLPYPVFYYASPILDLFFVCFGHGFEQRDLEHFVSYEGLFSTYLPPAASVIGALLDLAIASVIPH